MVSQKFRLGTEKELQVDSLVAGDQHAKAQDAGNKDDTVGELPQDNVHLDLEEILKLWLALAALPTVECICQDDMELSVQEGK